MPHRSPSSPARLRVAARSTVGPVRNHNEDAVAIFPMPAGERLDSMALRQPLAGAWPCDPGLGLVVLDGMGGQSTGDVACELALVELSSRFREELPRDSAAWRAWVGETLRVVSRNVQEAYRAGSRGATAVLAVVTGNEVHVAHAGDVRAYLLHEGHLAQLTRDDSLLNDAREMGISEAQLLEMPPGILTKALGSGTDLPDRGQTFTFAGDDVLLIASDGLHCEVGDDVIARTLRELADVDLACAALEKLAEQNGGRDNISVLVARR